MTAPAKDPSAHGWSRREGREGCRRRRPPTSIWMNGKLVPWATATVHVSTHALHYGSSVFEGMRCYDTPKGPCLFRAKEHMRRFIDSGRVYRMQMLGLEELIEACKLVVRENGFKDAYLRPLAFRGAGPLGVNGSQDPDRHDHHGDAVGVVPRRGRAGERRRRRDLVVEPSGAEHHSAGGEGGRELPVGAAHRDGGGAARVPRRDRARRRRDRVGGFRREHLRDSGRGDRDAAGCFIDPARDHARHVDHAGEGAWVRGAAGADSARSCCTWRTRSSLLALRRR